MKIFSFLKFSPLINFGLLTVGLISGFLGLNLIIVFDKALIILRIIIPLVIFAIISTSISRFSEQRIAKKVSGFMVIWFLLISLVAGLFAGIFILFFFPPQITGTLSWSEILVSIKKSLGQISLDPNFIAILIGLGLGLTANLYSRLNIILELNKIITEKFINLWKKVLPLLLFLGGNYIGALSQNLNQDFYGLFSKYFILSFLMLFVGILWQGIWLLIIKFKYKANLRQFFSYYFKVYPFAWSTSSEAITLPINIEASKKLTYLNPEIRKLSATLGSGLNTPGSVMCGVIFAVAIPALFFNIHISIFQLILIILFSSIILGASPGIPGELILLTGLIISVINLAPELIPSFTAIWIGFQMGIPDGFRTAINVTDDEIYASIFDHLRKKELVLRKKLKELPILY